MKFRCKVCGYIHEGEEAPDRCPICFVTKDNFEQLDDEEN